MTDAGFEVAAADEGRHPPGAEELWGESWYLDWAAADGRAGGYVRLGLYPNLGRSWWWIALVGEDRPTVLVVDHDLPCPDGDAACHVTTGATRVDLDWPEPLRRFRVRSAATGVRLADPADAFRGPTSVPPGDPVAVELDLTWESRTDAFPYAMTTRYEVSSWVRGTVRIGDESLAVDCAGQRDHSWGVRDWWLFPWNWTSGHLDDGSWFHAARSTLPDLELFATGYTATPAGVLTPADVVTVDADLDADRLPVAARQQIGPVRFTTEPIGHGPLLLVAPDGRRSRFPRAMCRYTTEDGRVGTGWTEHNLPQ
jgi:hypothetical protein